MNSLFGINAIKVVNLKLRDTVTFKLMVLVLAHFVLIQLRFNIKMDEFSKVKFLQLTRNSLLFKYEKYVM